MKKITAVYPGSFDPITMGHVDLVERSIKIFDRLIVAILINPYKKPFFSLAERKKMIRSALAPYGNSVAIEAFDGLLVNFAKKMKASVIIRGLREISDFEYEFQMALMNRRLNDNIETVFMMPKEEYSYLSSHLVKEIALLGGDIRGLVPKVVEDKFKKINKKRKL